MALHRLGGGCGMIVVGLDTDSHGYAWAASHPLWDGLGDSSGPSLVGYVRAEADTEGRRAMAYLSAKGFFSQRFGGELHVFCEEPLALQNGKTTRILSLTAGAIWAAFVEAGGLRKDRYWYWVNVAHWKKEVVGKGNCNKGDIRAYCLSNPAFKHDFDGMPEFDEVPDLYDAWCLKIYGVRALAGRSDPQKG